LDDASEIDYSGSMTWLDRTGQRWKVRALWLLIAVSLAAFLIAYLMLASAALSTDVQAAAIMSATALGLSTFIWFLRAIRCPACGRRPAWALVRSQSIGLWLPKLLSATACPLCADAGRPPTGRPAR
jgi:hypothetical protein